MPEGRYRPLLCLVQIAVAGEIAVLDPLDGAGFDPAPLAEVLADPAIEIVLHAGRQDVAILRREWSRRRSRTSSTRRWPPASPASRRRPATTGCCTTCCGSGCPRRASFTRWDARPLTDEQVALRPRRRRAPAGARRRLQSRLVDRGPARVGARGVRRDRRGDRRARSRRGLAAAAARERAGPARARRRARRSPPGASARPPARTGRSARSCATRPSCELAKRQPTEPPRAGADPRHHARRGAPARRRHPGGDRARPARRSRSGSTRATARRPSAVDGPTIALAESLVRIARAGGRAGLRADRRARGPRADRRRRPSRRCRARRAHAAGLAARAGRRRAARAAGRPARARRRHRRPGRRQRGLRPPQQRRRDSSAGRRRCSTSPPDDDQPVDHRADQQVDRQIEVDVGAQLAALLRALEDLAHRPRRRGSTRCS